MRIISSTKPESLRINEDYFDEKEDWNKMRKIKRLAVMLLMMAFFLGGCKKEEEIDRPESSSDSSEDAGNTGSIADTDDQTTESIANTDDQNTEYDRNEEIYREEAPGSEENILQSVMIESEKTNNGDIVVFITNNNPYSIPDLDVQAVFYKDGKIIDTDTDGHDVLVPENTVVSKLDSPDDYDNYEVKVTVNWNYAPSYRNWIYNLNVNSNVGEDGIIIQFENAGNIDIDELEYIVVFYNDNVVSDTSHPEDIRDVKAGSVVIEKVPAYRIEFDGYEIYINQAHTFFDSDGEVIKDTIPENIGKGFIYPASEEEH